MLPSTMLFTTPWGAVRAGVKKIDVRARAGGAASPIVCIRPVGVDITRGVNAAPNDHRRASKGWTANKQLSATAKRSRCG